MNTWPNKREHHIALRVRLALVSSTDHRLKTLAAILLPSLGYKRTSRSIEVTRTHVATILVYTEH